MQFWWLLSMFIGRITAIPREINLNINFKELVQGLLRSLNLVKKLGRKIYKSILVNMVILFKLPLLKIMNKWSIFPRKFMSYVLKLKRKYSQVLLKIYHSLKICNILTKNKRESMISFNSWAKFNRREWRKILNFMWLSINKNHELKYWLIIPHTIATSERSDSRCQMS